MESFNEIMKDLRVLARANADVKKKLAVGLKACGAEKLRDVNFEDFPTDAAKEAELRSIMMKVSVTGEGISDVEALKEAQVGLAMGSGCPAAKDAAQLVITDNNF